MDLPFIVVEWAFRFLGWVLGLFIVLTLACAAITIVAWTIFWMAMGW